MDELSEPGRALLTVSPSGRFTALRIRSYRVLWSSGAFMFFAIQAQQVARSWLAIELTGTNTGLGAVYLAFGLPMLLLGPMGGVIADRFAKRTVLMSCQAAILAGALAVALALELDALEYWMLLVTAVVHGAAMAVMGPTIMAYTGEVVNRALLPNAVVLQLISANGTRIIGPAIAGALIGIETIGAGGVYLLTSAMVLISIGISWFLPRGLPRQARELQSPITDLVDGVRYLRSRRPVLLLVVVSTVVIMVGYVYIAFLPSLAKDEFDVGSAGYGLMSMVGAVGALGVSLWAAGRVYGAVVWRMQTVFGLAFGLAILLLGLSPTFAVALVVLAVLGGAASGFQATNNSLVLTETELEYHGRMQSLLTFGFAASGIVALPLGAMADAIGLRQTLAAMGTTIVVVMVLYARVRRRYVTPG